MCRDPRPVLSSAPRGDAADRPPGTRGSSGACRVTREEASMFVGTRREEREENVALVKTDAGSDGRNLRRKPHVAIRR